MNSIAATPAIVQDDDSLESLAVVINGEHEAGEMSLRRGLEHYRACGEALLKAKARIGHGGWLKWLKTNVRFSRSRAQQYMQLAKLPVTGNSDLEAEWRRISGNMSSDVEEAIEEPAFEPEKTIDHGPTASRDSLPPVATPVADEQSFKESEETEFDWTEEYAPVGDTEEDEVIESPDAAEAKREEREQKKLSALHEAARNAPPSQPDWVVVNGECTEWIDKIANERGPARLVFADPPYNIGIDYGQGMKADLLPRSDYLSWCSDWIDQCRRALTDDGSFWLLVSDDYAAELCCLAKQSGLKLRSWIKWYETFGVNCSDKFNRTSRHIFYFVVNESRYVFHPEAVNRPSARQVLYNDGRAREGGKLWDDVWAIPRLTGTCAERMPGFPTQIPLAVLRPIIACASDAGDLVIDPFCGSGTTGHAAIEAGRRFAGTEKSEQFAELARLRLKGVTAV